MDALMVNNIHMVNTLIINVPLSTDTRPSMHGSVSTHQWKEREKQDKHSSPAETNRIKVLQKCVPYGRNFHGVLTFYQQKLMTTYKCAHTRREGSQWSERQPNWGDLWSHLWQRMPTSHTRQRTQVIHNTSSQYKTVSVLLWLPLFELAACTLCTYEHNVINTYMYMYVRYQSPKKALYWCTQLIITLSDLEIYYIYTCTPVHKLYDCNKDLSLSLSLSLSL